MPHNRFPQRTYFLASIAGMSKPPHQLPMLKELQSGCQLKLLYRLFNMQTENFSCHNVFHEHMLLETRTSLEIGYVYRLCNVAFFVLRYACKLVVFEYLYPGLVCRLKSECHRTLMVLSFSTLIFFFSLEIPASSCDDLTPSRTLNIGFCHTMLLCNF